MVIPLLSTKLYVPPAPSDLVSRPRLIEQLEAGPDGEGYADVYLVKTDAQGSPIWSESFGAGAFDVFLTRIGE